MPKKPDLKALQAEWYKKLKDEGFDDIEQDEDTLKKWSTTIVNRTSSWGLPNGRRTLRLAREEYYRLAGHFLWDYPFTSTLERKIWKLHAEGLSFRDIAKTLKVETTKINLNKDSVNNIVKKLSEIMIKQYLGEKADE